MSLLQKSVLHKAGFGLIALAALGQASAAHALTGVDVVPTVTGTTGAYNYSYKVTPTVYSANQFAFTFTDPNVTFDTVSGPLNKVLPTSPGSFINYSATGKSLGVGSLETIVFSSPDASLGGTLNVAATGLKGSAASLPAAGPRRSGS